MRFAVPCAVPLKSCPETGDLNRFYLAYRVVDGARQVVGIVGREDFAFLRGRPRDDVGFSRLVPFLGAHAVAEEGIDIFLLHQRQRLLVAEIMTRTADAHIADDFDGQRLVIHFDAAHIAVDRAQHVIVDEQAFEAETEKRGMHAGTLIEEIDAGHRGKRRGDPLLIARLHVGQLRIAHACRRADGELVEMAHIGASGGDERLLARAARHGAGPEIGYERPWSPDRHCPGLDGIHIGKPRQALRHCLHHRAGKCCRRGRTRLCGG